MSGGFPEQNSNPRQNALDRVNVEPTVIVSSEPINDQDRQYGRAWYTTIDELVASIYLAIRVDPLAGAIVVGLFLGGATGSFLGFIAGFMLVLGYFNVRT